MLSSLIRDLSGRVPYGVKFQMINEHGKTIVETVESISYGIDTMVLGNNHCINISNCKPFLFRLDVIEDRKTFKIRGEKINFFDELEKMEIIVIRKRGLLWTSSVDYDVIDPVKYYDFLDQYYIDYRGLIDSFLAIEITKENNPYE